MKTVINILEKALVYIGYALVLKTVITVTLTALKSLDNGELGNSKDIQSEA